MSSHFKKKNILKFNHVPPNKFIIIPSNNVQSKRRVDLIGLFKVILKGHRNFEF
jgi:hypothetical protein